MNDGEYIEQMNIRHDIEVSAEEAYMEQERIKMQMIEIKFRGYNVELHKWVYGFYVEVGGDSYIYDPEQSKISVCDDDSPNIGFDMFGFFEVDPKSVGQYAWLKDKNSKEIYGGDIVKIKLYEPTIEEYYGKVCQQRGCWWIWGKSIDLLSNFNEKCEIVGNIYENPELLNKKNNKV